MSRIFISHAGANAAEAIALRDWLVRRGWADLFLDLDPERGIVAGEKWQLALKRAAHQCEIVICLISPEWAASKWCLAEFLLAKHLNKQILGVVVKQTPFADLPRELTAEWQVADLTLGARKFKWAVEVARQGRVTISFSEAGLEFLRGSLMRSGRSAADFPWPPDHDPARAPYRGLRPLDADDAGILFGRDGQLLAGMELIRSIRDLAPPRILTVLGASGSGKSSFMRAGLLPRLQREDHDFLVLPVIRPERGVLTGDVGLISCLHGAFTSAGLRRARAAVRNTIERGSSGVSGVLSEIASHAFGGETQERPRRPPTMVLPIDQAEGFFLSKGAAESREFLGIVRDLLSAEDPALLLLLTIRSNTYETLQSTEAFLGLRQHTLSLPTMPRGSYADVIRGPARRLEGTNRELRISETLVDALLTDIEGGGGKDALPLLAFTLERLYLEHGGDGELTLDAYEAMGGVGGSIEAAVARALRAADRDEEIPARSEERLELLRRGLVPRLAALDPMTGIPQCRIARREDIPTASLPLIDLLVEQRLLVADVDQNGEGTLEPAHEALLRQWEDLRRWLAEDAGLLAILESVRRGARAWSAQGKSAAWLAHVDNYNDTGLVLSGRSEFADMLSEEEMAYLVACRAASDERAAIKSIERERFREMEHLTRELLVEELRVQELTPMSDHPGVAEEQRTEIERVRSLVLIPKKWHPSPAQHKGSTGAAEGYAEIFLFPCCGLWTRDFLSTGQGDPPTQVRSDGCAAIPDAIQYAPLNRCNPFRSRLVSLYREQKHMGPPSPGDGARRPPA